MKRILLYGLIIVVFAVSTLGFVSTQPLYAELNSNVDNPAIQLVKSVNATTIHSGDAVQYTFNVTNIGDTTLYNVIVVDDTLDFIADPVIGPVTLAPDESNVATINVIISGIGTLTNTAKATGTTLLGTNVTNTDTVTITVMAQEPVHDVEAFSQTVTDNEVMPGDVVDIEVTVRNNGDFTETFNLTCYYDSVELGTILVVDLAPAENRFLFFTWDTTGVPLNGYLITAWADSSNTIAEVDESNNWCTMPLQIFVVPEVPLGTVMTILSMFIALVGFAGFKRFRPKPRPQ